MPVLFNRKYKLEIISKEGELLRFSLLKIDFDFEKTFGDASNKGRLAIYNLSPDTRGRLQEGAIVKLFAGYQDDPGLAFRGKVSTFRTEKDGPNLITELELADGLEIDEVIINRTFGPDATAEEIFNAMVQDLVKEGTETVNGATEFLAKFGKQILNGGFSFSGMMKDGLRNMAGGMGADLDIQDNTIRLLEKGKALNEDAVLLSSTTGLIGIPEELENGGLRVKSLLNGEIKPGRAIDVRSRFKTGQFIVETAKYKGDTFGNDWSVTADMKTLNTKAVAA